MSLADLLPAIRALPADDRRELVRLLTKELDGPSPPEDELPEHIRVMLRHGGVFSAGNQITTDAAGMQLLHDLMTGARAAE
jgi:hypothetical protein